jgi:tetratricopeptide (TPR) repeat protein
MKRTLRLALFGLVAAVPWTAGAAGEGPYLGSRSCRECHERFYGLWAPSRHGLAMQPFTAELARDALSPQATALDIGGTRYRVQIDDGEGRVIGEGPEGRQAWPMVHALGGKNVYYFLTLRERGHLQVLPLAYDLCAREWFDTAASAMRHIAGESDEPLDWRDRAYTFNSACFGCHVSQLETSYDLETDTYETTWVEPGINCETCHGPAGEHVRVFRAAPEGTRPEDPAIISTRRFNVAQTNDLCAACHSKGVPLTVTPRPGDRFFDNFGLVTLESSDYHPDGRDLGENYTQTSWLASPCVRSGELDCLHCHTSSGRFRQADDPNGACRPCHEARVADPTAHTHHGAESPGSLCISCHMPRTSFARMERHDHSMRPPTPATTIAFGSPNACNLCHADQDAAWADARVREWRTRDYQAPVLHRAGLVQAARNGDWARLSEMLDYLRDPLRDEITATSLVRLLRGCGDERKWAGLLAALDDPSPLVRSAAAETLGEPLTVDAVPALIEATRDDYRLVRVRAAASLAAAPPEMLKDDDRSGVGRATAEFLESMRSRPDDANSHYNLGNFHLTRGDLDEAIAAYETSLRLLPEFVAPRVNAALAYVRAGRPAEAEASLRRALVAEPTSAEAHFNLGLLLGETGRYDEARREHRAALDADPELAAAAFNLGVLLAKEDLDRAIDWCRRASELRPEDPRYAYTLAFYERQGGRIDAAVGTLRALVERSPAYADAWMLLGSIYEAQGDLDSARALYRAASERPELPENLRYAFAARVEAMAAEGGR